MPDRTYLYQDKITTEDIIRYLKKLVPTYENFEKLEGLENEGSIVKEQTQNLIIKLSNNTSLQQSEIEILKRILENLIFLKDAPHIISNNTRGLENYLSSL